MARPIKVGLDYFPFDTDFFTDRKIKILRARYGADGITVYLYLLCMIYREGYFIRLDDDLHYIIADELNMSSEKIGQIMHFLLERSLFSNTLFQSDKVLTSEGIQRRYQKAVEGRAKKTTAAVDERYWLLSEDETATFIKVRPKENYSGKNEGYSGKNGSYSREKLHKGKESKEKERKGERAREELERRYGRETVELYLKKAAVRNYQGEEALQRIEIWLSEDEAKGRVKRMKQDSFDMDKYSRWMFEQIDKMEVSAPEQPDSAVVTPVGKRGER